jgi:2-polyprenyl-3-methyl-5-hydroxy-6-metoxy-1,4-benzoquinol methylase
MPSTPQARRASKGWRLCKRCGNGFPVVQPHLAKLSGLWASNRDVSNFSEATANAMRQYRIYISVVGAERALKFYGFHVKKPPARFLDIGCGLGETVAVFKRAGYDATGIDADPSTAAHHQKIGINAIVGQVETVDLKGPYDVVHIAHAIYFVTKPMAFLARVRGLMADNGLLCITNADFTFWRDGSLPNEHHTFCPTPSSMRAALALAGFCVVAEAWIAGSVYAVCKKCEPFRMPVSAHVTWLYWQTKRLRYALFGKPANVVLQLVKSVMHARGN